MQGGEVSFQRKYSKVILFFTVCLLLTLYYVRLLLQGEDFLQSQEIIVGQLGHEDETRLQVNRNENCLAIARL